MRPDLKTVSAFSIIALATILSGAKNKEDCPPSRPATCYADDCTHCYCLGPENKQVNAPVRPITCNGDFVITVAGFYWKAEQDGMAYAINNEITGTDALSGNAELSNLIDAQYKNPNFKWDFGFKAGFAYNSACDGWDIGILWTYFREGAKGHVEAEFDDNHALLPIWSQFQYPNAGQAPFLFATDIETFYRLHLNLIDIPLGREFWTSKRLSFRPHVGLRISFIDQKFEIEHKGGSWSDPGLQIDVNDIVNLDNDYKGVGLRSGFDTVWHFGCGWGLYGNFALSVIYGKFTVDHDESLRDADSPFSKHKILETKDSFRASRGMLDMGLGIEWESLLCDCQYGLKFSLGWEQHLFFHQNQLWRVVRIGGANGSGLFNNSGENVYHQRRGTLGTQGWTLTGNFAF